MLCQPLEPFSMRIVRAALRPRNVRRSSRTESDNVIIILPHCWIDAGTPRRGPSGFAASIYGMRPVGKKRSAGWGYGYYAALAGMAWLAIFPWIALKRKGLVPVGTVIVCGCFISTAR